MNIAIIPARSGSRRIPNKNVRLFFGKPILVYSIEAARESRLFEEIIVSTDSPDYAVLAKIYGAKAHMRSRDMSADDVGTQLVTRVALDWWAGQHPDRVPSTACCIYATAPLMSVQDLRAAGEIMRLQNGEKEFVYGVEYESKIGAGQFYWGRADAFGRVPLEDYGIAMHISPERCCDINTEDDWKRAEVMYQMLQERALEARIKQR